MADQSPIRREMPLWPVWLLFVGVYGTAVAVNQTAWAEGRLLSWLHDDMMITMRYGRNVAAGAGAVWNAGGPAVEGYTDFAWMLLMALVHRLPLAPTTTSVVILGVNVLLAAVVLHQAAGLMRTLYPHAGLAHPAMMVALLLSYDLLRWTTIGLETTAQTALFLFLLRRVLGEGGAERPSPFTWLLAGGLGLIRADGALLIGLLVLVDWLLHRRYRPLWLLALLLPGAHLAWRVAYYGRWVPNTYLLKVSGVGDRLLPGWRYLLRLGRFYAPATAVAFAGLLVGGDRRRRILVVPGIVLLAYAVVAGGDDFAGLRFVAPWLPILLIVAFGTVAEKVPHGRLRPVALALLLLTGGIAAFYNPLHGPGYERQLLDAGRFLAVATPHDTVVGHFWAGTAAYFSERTAVDMLSKNDAVIAALPARPGSDKPGHNKFDYDHSLGVLRPDLVIAPVHPNDVATEAALAALSVGPDAYAGLFYLHPRFQSEYAGNLLLIGNVAVFVRKDWPGREGLMTGECLDVERAELVALGLRRVCVAE